AVYLLFVPDSKWYEARLSQKYDEEVVARRRELKAKVFRFLRPALQMRFERLEQTRDQINAQQQQQRNWFREVLRKLDYLLEKFLQFGAKENEFRNYLRSVVLEVTPPAPPAPPRLSKGAPRFDYEESSGKRWVGEPPADPADDWAAAVVELVQKQYKEQLAQVDAALAKDPDDLHTNAVLEKRREVLDRRHDYVDRMAKALVNLNHQLQLMEDTFGLINDQIRVRSPEQVLADIDDVVFKADAMADLLEEVSPMSVLPDRPLED
ncbi:MAG TPA: hypothetical protein VEX38_08500, partial [Fimbriimonadaceae bacterium]|nr:hypothetical protein [Fimbriimonadaceae bacterium]